MFILLGSHVFVVLNGISGSIWCNKRCRHFYYCNFLKVALLKMKAVFSRHQLICPPVLRHSKTMDLLAQIRPQPWPSPNVVPSGGLLSSEQGVSISEVSKTSTKKTLDQLHTIFSLPVLKNYSEEPFNLEQENTDLKKEVWHDTVVHSSM